MGGREHRHGRLEPGLQPARKLDRLASQRGQDVAVRRVPGAGQRDPVAWVECGKERQREAAGGARRDCDAAWIEPDVVPVPVVRSDRRAQSRDPQGLGVPEAATGVKQVDRTLTYHSLAPAAGSPAARFRTSWPRARRAFAAAMISMTANGGTWARAATFMPPSCPARGPTGGHGPASECRWSSGGRVMTVSGTARPRGQVPLGTSVSAVCSSLGEIRWWRCQTRSAGTATLLTLPPPPPRTLSVLMPTHPWLALATLSTPPSARPPTRGRRG